MTVWLKRYSKKGLKMDIRILQSEEIRIASGLSRYVFDTCLRNRMEYPQTIAFVDEYIAEENMTRLQEECKLVLWGVFEENQLVAVSGMQMDGMITMLYVLPQCQNQGYGSRLLSAMRNYAKDIWGCSKVTLNANPAWTSFYFKKRGFSNINPKQDIKVPFIPMSALSTECNGYEKRKISKKWISLTIVGCILFATIAGSLFMISYLF